MTALISDALLTGATLLAAIYCFVLSRRVRKLSSFDSGLGGAIAVLSKQVDDMQNVLRKTEQTAQDASEELRDLVQAATQAADNLELMLAGLDDIPEPAPTTQVAAPPPEPAEPAVVSFATARHRAT